MTASPEGVGVKNPETVYHQRIKRRFGLAEARNYGIGGARIAKQIKPQMCPYGIGFLKILFKKQSDLDFSLNRFSLFCYLFVLESFS